MRLPDELRVGSEFCFGFFCFPYEAGRVILVRVAVADLV